MGYYVQGVDKMKKIRIFSILLLLASTAAFILFRFYEGVVVDNDPPVVTCASEELTVSIEDPEEALMKGVTAEDRRSGDVTDTIVLEKLSAFTEEGVRIATYAAVDESMNVGRAQRSIRYEGYEAPRFEMTSDLCFATGDTAELLTGIKASSGLDGDLTHNIKYTLEESIDTMKEGAYPIEYRVMDSGGNNVYLNTQVQIYDADDMGIEVQLSEYLVYVKKGSSFKADNYYKGASAEGTLKIKSNVDTKETGTYYVDYIVKGAATAGRSRLVVVVE